MLLYFAYRKFPNRVLAVVCCVAETNFQHYKAAFHSWSILGVLEFVVYRDGIGDFGTYIHSRMGTAAILPWFVFLLWYLGPALWGRLPSIPLEIVYANVVTVAAGVVAAVFERGMAQIEYPLELRIVVWFLFFASIALYTIFTFVGLPWADVFTEPDWKQGAGRRRERDASS